MIPLNIYKDDNYISGFFLDYGFTYDKDLIIYTEDSEYKAVITKNKDKFNVNNYEPTTLKDLLSIIK